MEPHGEEIHIDARRARGAGGPRAMGVVLGVSLLLAVAVLSVLWIAKASHTADVTDPAQRPAAVSTASPAPQAMP